MVSFGVSFFSDVHARQRVALHSLLKSTFIESCVAHLVRFGVNFKNFASIYVRLFGENLRN